MSLNDIDDTLVAYFKQMLDEEVSDAQEESTVPEVETQSAEQNSVQEADTAATVEVVNLAEEADDYAAQDVSEEDIDYASDDYNPDVQQSLETDSSFESSDISLEPLEDEDGADETVPDEPQMQLQTQESEESSSALPYAEHRSIASLLENVDTRVEVVDLAQTETETETETVTETETQTQSVQAQEQETAAEVSEDAQNDNPYEWENIDMPNEFQVLFFLVKGIRFAVPLVNLGGIFQSAKVTPLFGKPKWFMGLADVRGKKMNVVDTLKWVKSDAPQSDKYEYMIVLDKTLWSIGCDELEGNRILSKDNITWRQQAGNRPWLAGIVKKEMCALLHVEALIKMFENGVNLKDLDTQMSS